MIKLRIVTFCIISAFFLIAFFTGISGSMASSNSSDINIATSPENILFDVNNLKPGDWIEKTVTIQNNGEKDFKYITSGKFKLGSEKFFNELLLKISDNDKVLFEGKMKDFQVLDSRKINKDGAEQLFFKVGVPEKLGNDYQGLSCEVEFKFYFEGTLGGILPVDGPKLPATGTAMFNILVSGFVLVLLGVSLQMIVKNHETMKKQL